MVVLTSSSAQPLVHGEPSTEKCEVEEDEPRAVLTVVGRVERRESWSEGWTLAEHSTSPKAVAYADPACDSTASI